MWYVETLNVLCPNEVQKTEMKIGYDEMRSIHEIIKCKNPMHSPEWILPLKYSHSRLSSPLNAPLSIVVISEMGGWGMRGLGCSKKREGGWGVGCEGWRG